MGVCVCVGGRGLVGVGVPEQVRVIFTTESANGAKLLALQLSNAIAQRKKKNQKKKKRKTSEKKQQAKYVSRRTLSFRSNFWRPVRT